jgi:2-polyprenyl-6-methoxyphenol hydroxylase-like FAD-dependent oxidoreductase
MNQPPMPSSVPAHQGQSTARLETDVAIVGGGPTGLMLAIELGCRGVPCVVIEEDAGPAPYPKANANSSRTMEHYRRRGFAQRVRALGLPPEHPQDVVYCTRFGGAELARLRLPSSAQAARGEHGGDFSEAGWPTPELPHRAQQIYVEPVLWDEARRHASVTLRAGFKVGEVLDGPDAAEVMAHDGQGGELRVKARYVVGCEGARSAVRAAMGAEYEGEAGAVREFFGGQMCSLYLRAPALAEFAGQTPAWQNWVSNPAQRGIVMAVDGVGLYVVGIQLAPGQRKEDVDVQAVLDHLVGRRFAYELLSINTWLAGYTLVANRYATGRMFIAGDAAHLFTPAAGMGYNTAIDDAVNLGWKLAGVVQGWAGESLLDSYEAERRPIGLRNTAYARDMADSMGRLRPPPALEEPGAAGEAARQQFAQACRDHLLREYNIPGLQLGLRYASAVVAREVAVEPHDDRPTRYQPSGYPGVRAPHVALDGDPRRSIFDLFGRDFTLLCPDADAPDVVAWRDAAARHGLPLTVLAWPGAAARALYGADLCLVRPDHHIAWRGALEAPAADVLARAVARAPVSPDSATATLPTQPHGRHEATA